MISPGTYKKLSLSFPETTAHPHFENLSFKVKSKIFATLNEKDNRACVKLSLTEQSSFCCYDPKVMYPVPNKWGKLGWTNIELKSVRKTMLVDALTTAYCGVAPAALSKKYREAREKL